MMVGHWAGLSVLKTVARRAWCLAVLKAKQTAALMVVMKGQLSVVPLDEWRAASWVHQKAAMSD